MNAKIDLEINDKKLAELVKKTVLNLIENHLNKHKVVDYITNVIKKYVDEVYNSKMQDLYGRLYRLEEKLKISKRFK